MSRSERRSTTVAGRIAETAARRAARWGGVLPVARETPALDEARAEFGSARPPLVVETLQQRLERLVPGARMDRSTVHAHEEQWRVQRGQQLLAVGASQREAIDRAVFLWGAR